MGQRPSPVFSAVLFDMDGTLIDSTPAVERVWRTWASSHEVRIDFAESHGRPAADILRDLLPATEVASALAELTAMEESDTEGIAPLPGAVAALDALASVPHAIVTSCPRPLAEIRLAATGIPRPDLVITADDVTRGKPDPEPFLLAARMLDIAPRECLVVEDAAAGLAAASSAGMSTLAVTAAHGRTMRADWSIDTLADVTFEVTGTSIMLRWKSGESAPR